jgi:hypothetical protein
MQNRIESFESIEKITWRFGEPKDWSHIYSPNEVPFACMCCRKKTATHTVKFPDGFGIVKVVVCEDCTTKTPAQVIAGMKKR